MLVIDPSSHCDVCCESFTSLPQCIDCGHIFCSKCLDSICEKTWSPRTQPSCPFCRESFTKTSIRNIRVDLNTPRPPLKEVDDDDYNPNLSQPSDAKRLEEKVAKAAASKCSFEEVSELHKEIQQWLAAEVKRTSSQQHASLQLSAALLRAILLNCLAYSEASKAAKNVETTLKSKLDDALLAKEQIETELVKHRTMYTQKSRECTDLRSELNRLRLVAAPSAAAAAPRPLAITAPPHNPASPSPLSRSSTVRSSTPHPQPSHRAAAYIPRPASTMPSLSSANSHSRAFSVGSAPSSHTISPLRYQTSPQRSRLMSARSASPTNDDNPHQRWLPSIEDNESVISDKRAATPFPERFSTASGAAASSRWPARFHTPAPVV